MRRPWPRAVFWGLASAWMGFLFYWSGRPAEDLAGQFPGPTGNLLHLLASGLLALAFARALAPRAPLFALSAYPGLLCRDGAIAFGLVFAHGLCDETHQHFVPGRSCSLYDLLVNQCGAAFVLTLPLPLARGRPRSYASAVLALGLGVFVAIQTATVAWPLDGVLAALLRQLGFAGA